ncbi:MAG: antitoxin VapB family protein [Verrucomicrobiota bacterium]
MSTKTIAVESSVYERLAREKRPSESFTKTINRLIQTANSGTCASAVAAAAPIWQAIGNEADAGRMEQILRHNRSSTDWEVESPT